MKYIVGRWKDYSFVYDTDDCSCIMQLNIAENYEYKDYRIPYSKLRMLYGFKEDRGIIPLIASYNQLCRCDDSGYARYIQLGIFIIYIRHDDIISESSDIDSRDFWFLHIDSDIDFDLDIAEKYEVVDEVLEMSYVGIRLPDAMVEYLLRQRKCYNIRSILHSLDGLASYNISLVNNSSGVSYSGEDTAVTVEKW